MKQQRHDVDVFVGAIEKGIDFLENRLKRDSYTRFIQGYLSSMKFAEEVLAVQVPEVAFA